MNCCELTLATLLREPTTVNTRSCTPWTTLDTPALTPVASLSSATFLPSIERFVKISIGFDYDTPNHFLHTFTNDNTGFLGGNQGSQSEKVRVLLLVLQGGRGVLFLVRRGNVGHEEEGGWDTRVRLGG
jgi:hypothetical protein